ncbi:hypothetical protein [Elongatibacter sediminis]|uniref:TonB C-terminal domain-containing protein n=1 Tax=Elongatibacter sediminis TaxID=3119006 RepID=A0AAW9RE63_9GAMM
MSVSATEGVAVPEQAESATLVSESPPPADDASANAVADPLITGSDGPEAPGSGLTDSDSPGPAVIAKEPSVPEPSDPESVASGSIAPENANKAPGEAAALPQSAEMTETTASELAGTSPGPGVASVEPRVAARSIRKYESQVRALEARGGYYDADLAETLVGLGLARLSLHDYDGAERAFRRALHTTRVNHGLYSVEQLPIVERLLDVNTRTRDYRDLNQNYHFLFWLTKRIYGDDDPRLLPELDRMGRWHLAAYATNADDTPMSHLFAAQDLYGNAISVIEANFDENDPQLVNALYAIVVTKYQMAAEVSRIQFEGDVLAADSDTLDARASRVYRDGAYREKLMFDCFADGKEAMDRIAAIHAGNDMLPAESHAMALVHLGDWNLLFNKWNSAHDAYSEAYALLADEGRSPEVINGFFEAPRALPAIGLPEDQLREFLAGSGPAEPRADAPDAEEGAAAAPVPPAQDTPPDTADAVEGWDPQDTLAFAERGPLPEVESEIFVTVGFDVSRTGKPTNIEILDSNTEDKSLWRKARKSMTTRRFRPRIENGEAVDAAGVQIKMIFRDQP